MPMYVAEMQPETSPVIMTAAQMQYMILHIMSNKRKLAVYDTAVQNARNINEITTINK